MIAFLKNPSAYAGYTLVATTKQGRDGKWHASFSALRDKDESFTEQVQGDFDTADEAEQHALSTARAIIRARRLPREPLMRA